MSLEMPLVVVAGLIQRQGKVLLATRPPGTHLEYHWELPGGKLGPGESPQVALARELWEELGIRVEVGDIFHVHYHPYDSRHVLLLTYHCRLVSGEPRGREGQECAWVPPSQVPELQLAPADVPAAHKLAGLDTKERQCHESNPGAAGKHRP